MASLLLQTDAVAQFSCTGDKCPDTCCKGWGMQLTQETVKQYEQNAPELLDAVTSGEAEWIMKRDPTTDYCVKFDNGWCGIHAQYGDAMLGDACHFFPRITRAYGDNHFMSASISCPEIARISLFSTEGFSWRTSEIERTPYSLKEYQVEGIASADAQGLHQLFLDTALAPQYHSQDALIYISSVARSLDFQPKASWKQAAEFYLRTVESRRVTAEPSINDPFNLINALQGLIGAARKSNRERLLNTIETMARALSVTLDWQTLTINTAPDSATQYERAHSFWQLHCAEAFDPILKRWLAAQLSSAFFPFAGLGHTLSERITIIGVRLATVRLALMCACYEAQAIVPHDEIIRIIQSLARFMDHLADPTFSLAIYAETGWVREARLAGLLA